jgi:hypothetical protein
MTEAADTESVDTGAQLYVNNQQMHYNIYDVFCAHCCHQLLYYLVWNDGDAANRICTFVFL